MVICRSIRLLATTFAASIPIIAATQSQVPPPTATQLATKAALRTAIVLTPSTVAHVLRRNTDSWSPSVNTSVVRGAEQYAEVAPAVVVVRTRTGHGTGFFVRSDGVLVTNNHVIASGLWHDASGSYAMIHTGSLGTDGAMHLDSHPVKGYVLKHDPAKDLALLKVAGDPPRHALKLADSGPKPGMRVFVVGHPSSGMLWTYRSGEVASIGRSPSDMVNIVMPILAASEGERLAARQFLDESNSEKIVLTSVIANPGDSGGPVVNSDGRVVAVTFAVPADASQKAFSYHIHLDELRAFLREVPTRSTYVVPDEWDIGPQVRLVDLDNDGKPDALVTGDSSIEEVMFDLGNQTDAALTAKDRLSELIGSHRWRCDFAFNFVDGIAFYDRDGDGAIDTVIVPSDSNPAVAAAAFVLSNNEWRYQTFNGAVVNPSTLAGARGVRLAQLLSALAK